MKIIATILTAALIATASLVSSSKQTITATVVNATSDEGKVSFALYDKETFMKTPLQAKKCKDCKWKKYRRI